MFIEFILNKPYKHIIRGEISMKKRTLIIITIIVITAIIILAVIGKQNENKTIRNK